MNAHLLRLLTALPDTPGYFPELVPPGSPNRDVADYFDVMHESLLKKLVINVPVHDIGTQAGVFLDKVAHAN